jgi:hypothetical protein
VDQISGTTSTDAPPQAQDGSQPADAIESAAPPDAARAGFGSRGRARRRARFLRKARELAYRDLGGLVFNLHRFGQRNDALVLAKLNTLSKLDAELRALERMLREREPVTVLHEAGITACPRCAAIHSSEDRFCPNCGLPMARNVDLPIAGPAVPAAPSPAPATPTESAPPAPSTPTGPAAPTPATPTGPAAPAAAQSAPPSAPPVVASPAEATDGSPAEGAGGSPPPGAAAPGSSPAGPAGSSPPAASQTTAVRAPVPAHQPGAEPTAERDETEPTAGRDETTEILRPNAPAP